jgi:hypothetical protein
MDCGLSGSLLVLEATIGRLFEAANVALNSSGEATIIPSKAQDGCCIAGALWAEPLAHAVVPFPSNCSS